MRKTSLAMTLLFVASTGYAQVDVGNVFRSLSGALRGGEAQKPPQQQGATTVMGVRGIDEVDGQKTATAPAAGADLTALDNWAVTRTSAERAAAARQLAARPVALRSDAPAAQAGGAQ